MSHKFLPHCWVCDTKFVSHGGTAMEERHHIIPRAYGGEDGPQVSLCDMHHKKIDAVAALLPRPVGHLMTELNPVQKKRLLYLATRVMNAKNAVENDPNKHTNMMILVDPVMRKQLDDLKPVFGTKSRESVLRSAVALAHRKAFPLKSK